MERIFVVLDGCRIQVTVGASASVALSPEEAIALSDRIRHAAERAKRKTELREESRWVDETRNRRQDGHRADGCWCGGGSRCPANHYGTGHQ